MHRPDGRLSFTRLIPDEVRKCSSKGEIVILLDKPGSIGKENFEILKNFILDFLVHFVIGPNANQISVVSFDDDSKEEFNLNPYSSLNEIRPAISAIEYSKKGANIGNVLNVTRQNSFTSSRGARSDAAIIVILITDEISSISNEAKLLKENNVTIFCVGVTGAVNEQVLQNVSSHSSYTYITDNFTDLSLITPILADRSCADHIDDCLSNPCLNGGTCEDQLGKYVCHCNGNTTSKDCYIPGLPDVRTGRGQTTKLGTDANISCYPIYFTGIFWEFQHNGVTSIVDTSNSNKYSGGTVPSPSLTIRNFIINDIGSYRFSARNSKGTAHSPVMAFMDVPKCNISVSTLSTVTGVEGHNVTLICDVSSIYPPVISVTWKFNDIAIDTLLGGKYQGGSISSPSLFINNLNATDQGNYTCSATNEFNTRQAYVYLTLADSCDCACGTYYD
ncbi:uncharacterized protein LOC128185237 [Crassostrea angulata]|uniref:uncharacterized protein LOC128185237 n=1 Tax=Magallana angulata TaxID=2784310 RepID=UPI0022B187B5|nr:uncharacterized protein LOC128185237 [Crassostrea angulata]